MIVRPATVADARAIASVHEDTWRVAYRGQIPDRVLECMDLGFRLQLWRERLPKGSVFVADEDDVVIGFSDLVACRDKDLDPKAVAELVSIYVRPQHWRKGVGRALCHRVLREAKKQAYSAVTLWVLATNTPAKCFYERMGFQPDGGAKREEISPGLRLPELRFRIELK
ncbi:MAG TPA: GNAT family N-acetyltransferase [Verrucomicrobiae bacterium]|nr:GNAT family N-acetyltransferase [Verrucomicrobiae bacterium]